MLSIMVWGAAEISKLYCVCIKVDSVFGTWVLRLGNPVWVHKVTEIVTSLCSVFANVYLESIGNKYLLDLTKYYKPFKKLLQLGSADKYYELSKSLKSTSLKVGNY